METLPLSRREREIAQLVAAGASNKEIGHALSISAQTVKNTLTKIFAKIGVRSRTELAVNLVKERGAMLPAQDICRFSGGRCPRAVGESRAVRRTGAKRKSRRAT